MTLWQTVNSIVVVIHIPGTMLYVTGNHMMYELTTQMPCWAYKRPVFCEIKQESLRLTSLPSSPGDERWELMTKHGTKVGELGRMGK